MSANAANNDHQKYIWSMGGDLNPVHDPRVVMIRMVQRFVDAYKYDHQEYTWGGILTIFKLYKEGLRG